MGPGMENLGDVVVLRDWRDPVDAYRWCGAKELSRPVGDTFYSYRRHFLRLSVTPSRPVGDTFCGYR